MLGLEQWANFGFAALVAGFALVTIRGVLMELRDAVRDTNTALITNELMVKDALRENATALSRLADAINHSVIGREKL